MEDKEYQEFKDESGDRKYFAMVPYLITNGYNATTSGVYAYIKRRCGEDGGLFFEVKTNVCKKLKISYPTYKKIIDKLMKDGRIEFVGTKVFKTSPVKIYKIVDIWKENILAYEKRELKNIKPSFNRELKNMQSTELKNTESKKKQYKEDYSISKDIECEEEITFKIVPTKPYLAIIFTYAEAKGVIFDNEKQKQSFISRNARVAKTLEGESLDKIKAWCYILPYLEMKKWTLETIGKFLTEEPMDILMRYREDNYREVCEELVDESILKKVGHEYKLNV